MRKVILKDVKKVLIVILIVFSAQISIVLYLNKIEREKEIKRYTSETKKECGFFYRFEEKFNNKHGNLRFYYVRLLRGENMIFSPSDTRVDETFYPYWKENKYVLDKIKIGDTVCVTYSLKYNETHLFGRYDADGIVSPYLVKIEFQR